MSLSAYVEAANTLREIAILDPSRRAEGMNRARQDEILKQLRMQVENGRKLFVFSNTNASKDANLHIKEILIFNVSVSGLQAAAKVVDVGTSSMSTEERKRFDAVATRKRNYGSQYGGQYGSQYGNAAAQQPRNDGLISKSDLLKLLGGTPEGRSNPAARAVCQKVGHFAKNYSEPPRAMKPRVDVDT